MQTSDFMFACTTVGRTSYCNRVQHQPRFCAVQDAAHWLMDQEDLSKSETSWHACQEQKQRDAAEAARKEKEHRKQLVAKYHLQAVGTSAPTEPKQARQAPKSKVSKYSLVMVICLCLPSYVIFLDAEGGNMSTCQNHSCTPVEPDHKISRAWLGNHDLQVLLKPSYL